jgi:short subunit dehydrogenase-like uncharacterized protein
VLAARDAPRLETLAERLGRLDTAAADATRPDTVPALVEDGDVLVSTVGCHDGSSRVPDHPRLEAVTLREIACAT